MFQNTTAAILIGVIATAALDCWAATLNRVFGLPVTNWAHVGRWVAGVPAGNIRNESISRLPAVTYERALGWATHYIIGIAYAFAYIAILSTMSRTPDVYSALVFGACTVLAPWLILQPGLGAGYFASRSPRPNLTRSLNLLAHLVFGLGLYLGWQFLSLVG